MAEFVARNSIYPTVGELVKFIAVAGELVSTDGGDPVYNRLKPFVHEQKGIDFDQLDGILDSLQERFVEHIAPPAAAISFRCSWPASNSPPFGNSANSASSNSDERSSNLAIEGLSMCGHFPPPEAISYADR